MPNLHPDYLTPDVSERGFATMPVLNGEYGGEVDVAESSAASRPHLWLRVKGDPNGPGAALHLTADNAWRLAEQLRALVRNHYQGDATPDWAKGENNA